MRNPHDEFLEKMKDETGINLGDLIAMAYSSDPFYQGTDTHIEKARWFKENFEKYGEPGIHIRGLHYKMINRAEHRKGGMYKNTKNHYDLLNTGAEDARYFGFIDYDDITDKRNPDPYEFVSYRNSIPQPNIDKGDLSSQFPEIYADLHEPRLNLPEFDGMLGDDVVTRAEIAKRLFPYHIEIWIEKTGLEDVLKPFCKKNAINYFQCSGHPSIPKTLDFLKRVKRTGKPAKILYISDYDKSGQSMPKAVARKVEFFQKTESDYANLDISVEPIAIRPEQIKKYDLPTAPDTEKPKVELDALEALHPGEIKNIIKNSLATIRFSDEKDKVSEKLDTLESKANSIQQKVENKFGDRAEKLVEELWDVRDEHREKLKNKIADLKEELRDELGPYKTERKELEQEIDEFVENEVEDMDLPQLAREEAKLENDGQLFHSDREYLEQLKYYKEFQNEYEANLN